MCLCFEICALYGDVYSVLYLVIFVFYVVMLVSFMWWHLFCVVIMCFIP